MRENLIEIKNTRILERREYTTGLGEVCHMNAHLGGRVLGRRCLRTVSAIKFSYIIFEYAFVMRTLLATALKLYIQHKQGRRWISN